MHVTGACLCGAVTFSADVDPVKTMVCHCAECQVLGSTAFRIGAMVQEDDFEIAGATHEFLRNACAGPRSLVFCPTCGTAIYSYTPDSPAPMNVLSIGAVHQRNEIAPQFQIWANASVPWLQHLPDIPQVTPQEMMRSGQA